MNIQKILHEADPLIVDVREPFEFAMGHVEGATNVPLGQIPAHIDEYRDLGKPIVFPDGVEIVSVQTDADPEPITEGEADLYFFPRGQTQLAAIQLKGKPKLRQRVVGEDDIEYTILVQPLTGKVTVEAELIDLELPELVGDVEDDLGDKAERRSF